MVIPDAERWLEQHGAALYSFAIVHVNDAQRAEDLVQDTLLAALDARRRYQGSAPVRTWLTAILRHKIMDEYRRRGREAAVLDTTADTRDDQAPATDDDFLSNGRWRHPPASWGDPVKTLSGQRLWVIIERCLERLSPRMARLFVLRELWEMDTGEVCRELSMTPSNLWTTLHRARLSMRRCLERNQITGSNHDADV